MNISAEQRHHNEDLILGLKDRCVATVRSAIADGADVNWIHDERAMPGWSPIHYAVQFSDAGIQARSTEIIVLLRGVGADLGAKDRDGRTALHLAAFHDLEKICRLLLDEGCDIEAKDVQDCSPLHVACEHGHVNSALVLVAYGASRVGLSGKQLNITNHCDELQAAVLASLDDRVLRLLDAGMEPTVRGQSARSAIELAELFGADRIGEIIKAHAARKLALSALNAIDLPRPRI